MIGKITFKNQILAAAFFLRTSAILLAILVYLHFKPIAVVTFAIGQIVLSLPGWYLHLVYYLKNKGQEITITSNLLTIKDKSGERSYSNTEMEKIIFYRSAGFLSMYSYYYASIKLKSGEEIIFTRLLTPKVEEFVKQLYGVPYQRKVVLFANIR